MITLDQWCSGLPRFVPENAFVVVEGLLNVLAGGIAKTALLIMEEITAEMERNGTSAFELEVIFLEQFIGNLLGPLLAMSKSSTHTAIYS